METKIRFNEKMKEKIKTVAKCAFKSAVPLIAAAIIGLGSGDAKAESNVKSRTNILSASYQSMQAGAVRKNLNVLSFDGTANINVSDSEGEFDYNLVYGITNSQETKSNSQNSAVKPSDVCIRQSEKTLKAGESIIYASVSAMLDKIENGYAYVTVSEPEIISIGPGSGTIGVDDTPAQVRIGNGSEYPVSVPSPVNAGIVYVLTAHKTNNGSEVVLKLEEWKKNNDVNGNVDARITENKTLAFLGTNWSLGRDYTGEVKGYLGYGSESFEISSPLGNWGTTITNPYFGGLVSVQKNFSKLSLKAVLTDILASSALNEYAAEVIGVYGRYNCSLKYSNSCMRAEMYGNMESQKLDWISENLSLDAAANVGEVIGMKIGTGASVISEKDTANVNIDTTQEIGTCSRSYTSKTESLSGAISVSAEKGPVKCEISVAGGGGSSNVGFVVNYTW